MTHPFPHVPHDGGVTFHEVTGIGPSADCFRRDNSHVIRAGDHYYVYYNRGPVWEDFLIGWRGSVWAARSRNGWAWEEIGEMVSRGPAGRWDAWATYCPNILIGTDGRYYLYFTGQPACQEARTRIDIGLAVADSPEGPFERYGDTPIFSPTAEAGDFDGFRVDDATVFPRGGKYWMYYKGRGYDRPTSETKVGLALADRPQGPWRRHGANPVIDVGHEIMAWPHTSGVALYAWSHGPAGEPDHAGLYYGEDGVHFDHQLEVEPAPRGAGGYFPDNYDDPAHGRGGAWGICFVPRRGREYLVRFEMDLRADDEPGSLTIRSG